MNTHERYYQKRELFENHLERLVFKYDLKIYNDLFFAFSCNKEVENCLKSFKLKMYEYDGTTLAPKHIEGSKSDGYHISVDLWGRRMIIAQPDPNTSKQGWDIIWNKLQQLEDEHFALKATPH